MKRVDLITAGFPCQDVSVAGQRKGLAGERSGLFWELIRVARGLRPRWLLVENVPGLFSSQRGRDFETVLAALDELGYGVAWTVLDAEYFGVAQRRERVFLVGHLGAPCPPEVLFEPESLPGDTAPGREAGERTAALSASGVGTCGADDNQAQARHIVAQCHGSNVGEFGTLRRGNGSVTGGVPFTARSLTRSMFKGHDDDTDTIIAPTLRVGGREQGAGSSSDNTPIVAHPLRAEGADASEDGTGRGTPIVIQDARGVREKRQHGIGISEGPCYTLDSVSRHAIMFSDPRRHDVRGVHRGDVREKPSLNATNNDLLLYGAPRRLTPRECCRLQGFPDDWTLVDGASDSARYRALGNAVAVPVAEWIMRRIPAETVGELFAGIGGFGLAAHRAGKCVLWASEIDQFCRKVYATRFPDVELLGDVRDLRA